MIDFHRIYSISNRLNRMKRLEVKRMGSMIQVLASSNTQSPYNFNQHGQKLTHTAGKQFF